MFASLLDFFFPRMCPVCGKRLELDERPLCLRCNVDIPRTMFWEHPYDNPLARMYWGKIPVEKVAAYFYFTPQSAQARMVYGKWCITVRIETYREDILYIKRRHWCRESLLNGNTCRFTILTLVKFSCSIQVTCRQGSESIAATMGIDKCSRENRIVIFYMWESGYHSCVCEGIIRVVIDADLERVGCL